MPEVFLQTGLRLAEVAGLRTGDIELPTKTSPDPDNVGYGRVTRKGSRLATMSYPGYDGQVPGWGEWGVRPLAAAHHGNAPRRAGNGSEDLGGDARAR